MRIFLSHHILSPLQGMRLREWWGLLRDNGYQVDLPYLPRAALLTATSVVNSALSICEDTVYARRVAGIEVQPPLFILGHYRSGTTHLQNLLALDPQFAHPNLFQSFFPHTFLSTESWIAPIVSLFLIRHRFQDNVPLGVRVPMEDEIAMCVGTGISPHLAWAFPRNGDRYRDQLSFRRTPADISRRWQEGLLAFMKKLTYKTKKAILVKSPTHTGRIRLLLDLFPDARFIHISRDPYTIFASTMNLLNKNQAYWRLQRKDDSSYEERILFTCADMYDAFFDQKTLIPPGRYHDIRYERLEADPLFELQRAYEALDLEGFERLRPRLTEYLRSIDHYRKNDHSVLGDDLRRKIAKEWSRYFREWDYEP